jgi:hypothetical protein
MELQDGGAGSYPVEELYHVTAKPGFYAVSVDYYSSTGAPDFILRYYGVSYP